jgi:hypothetical protein
MDGSPEPPEAQEAAVEYVEDLMERLTSRVKLIFFIPGYCKKRRRRRRRMKSLVTFNKDVNYHTRVGKSA